MVHFGHEYHKSACGLGIRVNAVCFNIFEYAKVLLHGTNQSTQNVSCDALRGVKNNSGILSDTNLDTSQTQAFLVPYYCYIYRY